MDVSKVHQIIQTFERGMGIRLNRRKSEVLPMREWDAVFGRHGHPVRWQGNDFRHTIHLRNLSELQHNTWSRTVESIKCRAHDMYLRLKSLFSRIKFVYTFLVSKM